MTGFFPSVLRQHLSCAAGTLSYSFDPEFAVPGVGEEKNISISGK